MHFRMRSSEWLDSLSCAAQAATSCATTFPATFTKPLITKNFFQKSTTSI